MFTRPFGRQPRNLVPGLGRGCDGRQHISQEGDSATRTGIGAVALAAVAVLGAGESFQTMQTAGYGQVLPGVSFTPGAGAYRR